MRFFGSHVTPVPKGYLYFAISFSLMVEVIMKAAKRKNKIVLDIKKQSFFI
jgi:hypothetical protein